jgi:uncharacterized protein YkwD
VPVTVVRPCRSLLAVVLAVVVGLALIALPARPAVAATRSKAEPRAHVAKKTKPATKRAKATRAAVKPSQPVAAAASAPLVCTNTDLVPSPSNLNLVTAATLCLVNQQRQDNGLALLSENAKLDAAAAAHSADMVANDYFDHVSPSGSDPLSRLEGVGYIRSGEGYAIGENIAAATDSLATPASIVSMWMNSPGHRANILDPDYRDTGMGVAAAVPALLGTGPGGTYTQEFGAIS